MFLLLEDEKAKRRVLLNLDMAAAIIESETGEAIAISAANIPIPLGIDFDDVRDELTLEDDGPPEPNTNEAAQHMERIARSGAQIDNMNPLGAKRR